MAKTRKTQSDARLVPTISAASGVPERQVAAILEALTVEIKSSLGRGGAGSITLPGLMKIERKTVPGCPTWPASVKVSLAPELLPGPDSGCDRGLHTYFRSPATNGLGHPICGLCGQDTIDWKRLHKRDIADIDQTIAQLRTDRWNDKWWCCDIDREAIQKAVGLGPNGIEDAVRRRVLQSVGRMYQMADGKVKPFRDGHQTPFRGNIIYYGQHATATCCRKCIEVWHGTTQGRELSQRETDYFAALILAYVRSRVPELRGDAHPTQSRPAVPRRRTR